MSARAVAASERVLATLDLSRDLLAGALLSLSCLLLNPRCLLPLPRSLHAKIASLEGQNISLKAEVRDLSEQLSTALERAAQAEAAAQLAQASATPLPADEDECGADGNVPVETMSRDQLVKHVRALVSAHWYSAAYMRSDADAESAYFTAL